MIRKIPSPKADCVRVIFELPACIWADRIFLVGDFNEWNTAIAPFTQGWDGIWQAVVDLPTGREYAFRYLVDGAWQTDFHSDGWATNEYGSQNSIVSATLPPDSFPTLGDSSLLRERVWEASRIYRNPHALHPLPRTARDTPSQYFARPTRVAG